jgi:hypothetical protein
MAIRHEALLGLLSGDLRILRIAGRYWRVFRADLYNLLILHRFLLIPYESEWVVLVQCNHFSFV